MSPPESRAQKCALPAVTEVKVNGIGRADVELGAWALEVASGDRTVTIPIVNVRSNGNIGNMGGS